MKPKPQERSDCWVCGQGLSLEAWTNHTHPPVVVDNRDLFNSTETSELLIQVTFLCANAQAEDTKHSRGGGAPRGRDVSGNAVLAIITRTHGAWGGHLGGGDL